jgi:hypothetical protein
VSDDVLSLIPVDREYVPSSAAREKAAVLLQAMLPDGEMCEAKVYDELHFIDQGENCEAVLCPACGRRFELDYFTENDPGLTWWLAMSEAIAKDGSIKNVRATMPCCGASIPFTSLEFDWPAEFAHFALSIWNPNVADGRLTVAQLGMLEEVLGCKLKQIRAHY